MADNQYSVSPKVLTDKALIAKTIIKAISEKIQLGTSGNQN